MKCEICENEHNEEELEYHQELMLCPACMRWRH
jgi:hypothetical protein